MGYTRTRSSQKIKKETNQGIPDYSGVGVAKAKTKVGALVVLIAGFGQLYSGKTLSAAGFLLVEAGLVVWL